MNTRLTNVLNEGDRALCELRPDELADINGGAASVVNSSRSNIKTNIIDQVIVPSVAVPETAGA